MPDADGGGGACRLCADRSRAAISPTVPLRVLFVACDRRGASMRRHSGIKCKEYAGFACEFRLHKEGRHGNAHIPIYMPLIFSLRLNHYCGSNTIIMEHVKRNIIVCALVCVSLLICVSVSALELELDEEDETVVYVNGESETRSYRTVLRFLNKNPQVQTLVLEDIPGSNDDEYNIKICKLIYERELTTELVEYSIVESGGSDLFACGYKLIAHPEAEIGVHSWSDGDREGIDVPRDDPVHSEYLDLYDEVNIDGDFYWFTLGVASADDIHFMTAEEIEKYFGHKME